MSKKEKNTKAVFVIPDMGSGGAERVVSILANEFAERDIPVGIVYLLDDRTDYTLSEGVDKIVFNASGKGKAGALKEFRKLIKELKRDSYPVLIPFHDTCLKYCAVATRFSRVPVVACERNNPYIKGTSFTARLKSNLPFMNAKRCVFQTEGAKDYYYRSVRKKSRVISNPLNTDILEDWRGKESDTVVSVGRLEPQKNHAMLIDAFAKVAEKYPAMKLDIYGEGSLRDALEEKIKILGLTGKVTLRGLTDKIGEVLASSRMFVLSSDYEGMSNALIEAMAAGVPVVSTDHPTGGAAALIEDGVNGYLTPVGDADALAGAMIKCLSDPEGTERMAKEAKKIAAGLSTGATADKWQEVIEACRTH